MAPVHDAAATHGTLAEEVAAIEWYHTLELPDGVITPGWHDLRPLVDSVPLPESLAGARCLDVATFNGFWAFEMERRGAAEVIGIDVLDPREWDWPVGSDPQVIQTIGKRQARGRGFEIAKRELGSGVTRLERNVYDLDPADVGEFDLVYLGSLLIHLRDPVRALERVRSVCRGSLVVVDAIDLPLSLVHPRAPVATLDGRGRPWWWCSNSAGLAQMLTAAGFEVEASPRRLYVKPGAGQPVSRRNLRGMRTKAGRLALTIAYRGDPHAVVVGRPRI